MEVPTPVILLPSLERLLAFLGEEPFARSLQAILLLGASCLVFLVFYVTRDILSRTHAFVAQILCILLVAAFPLIGFFLYLLVRPGRTLKEREMEMTLHESLLMLKELREKVSGSPAPILKSTLIARGAAAHVASTL